MNINNNSRNSYPLLLKNAPCNEDLFEGKSHQDIANAISKTIITQEDATIIGIDGGWGSGKSNLVGLVKNMLSNESSSLNYHFFVYDAWGHQDDLQRRSILEELTDQLINGNKQQNQTPVLEKAKWSKKLKSLLARKREVETKSVPKLSIGIIASIAMLILTPIAGVVSDLIPEANSLCKVIIAVTPLTIGLLFMSYFRIKSMRKYGQAITFESFMSELFLIYQDKIKEDVTFETISEKEPSSREFKSWIHEIDNDLSDDKLVIVFDNMDRLPATKVQELWAVIHSFFADEKYKNICVIVPFDRAHIISAFKNENITQINNSEIANVPIEGSEPDSIGANVIQKTTFKEDRKSVV